MISKLFSFWAKNIQPNRDTGKVDLLVISVDFLPKIGGISIMTHELCNSFQDLGLNVLMLAPKGSYIPNGFVNNYNFLVDERYNKKARSGPNSAKEDIRIYDYLGKIIKKFNIERILLTHPFHYGVPAVDLAKKLPISVSVYFHGFELRSQLVEGYPRRQKEIIDEEIKGTLRERTFYVIGLANQILTNSSYTQKLFDGFSIKPNIFPTGCGINSEYFEKFNGLELQDLLELKFTNKRKYGSENDILIGYIGRIVFNKNIIKLLELVRINSNFKALIIGEGPQLEELKLKVVEFKIENRVTFFGGVSEDQKWKILMALDYISLFSLDIPETGNIEGFGISLIEGAILGAIPLSSGTGGMTDIVIDNETGLICDDSNIASFSEKIIDIYNDENEKLRLMKNARELVISKFNWKKIAINIAVKSGYLPPSKIDG